ncbi:MAG: TIM barrel protein [Dehalococcoides mccartyi]|uniref:TIM barrel protein n=1 Tax=Dehalococcoides mccartyi TaxID=61435 RepID=UPI0025CAB9AC|nr:TIM barrel protein [Dehalococcoides mccartyi]MDN4186019.1 TIM barrel protein [Dehalococcoides mccartyi]
MTGLLFGTAGIPYSTPKHTTQNGIHRVAELGLDGMEIEFVRGVYMKAPDTNPVRILSELLRIKLSAHAPYYLNFNAVEENKVKMSQHLLYQSAKTASLCGAGSLVFHPGFYLTDSPSAAYEAIRDNIRPVAARLREEGFPISLRPEVSGKVTQFGDLKETMALCSEIPGLLPTIDFSHYHARTGKFNSYSEFSLMLTTMADYLGKSALKNMHIHISGIDYSPRGERQHLNLAESDFNYKELLLCLRDKGCAGLVICESPNLEEDALLLKETYFSLA